MTKNQQNSPMSAVSSIILLLVAIGGLATFFVPLRERVIAVEQALLRQRELHDSHISLGGHGETRAILAELKEQIGHMRRAIEELQKKKRAAAVPPAK